MKNANRKNFFALTAEQEAAITLRIKACALLLLDSHNGEKIKNFAGENGLDASDAAYRFAVKSLKNLIVRGTARNYLNALEIFEDEQDRSWDSMLALKIISDKRDHFMDRGQLTRTESSESLLRDVERINRINAGVHITGTNVIHDYNIKKRNKKGEFVEFAHGITEIPHFSPVLRNKPAQTGHFVGIAKGEMLSLWEQQRVSLDPAVAFEIKQMGEEKQKAETILNENLRLFFNEYASRLSKTSKKALKTVINSKFAPEELTTAAARVNAETKKPAIAAKNLYANFRERDTVACDSCRTFIYLLRRYL